MHYLLLRIPLALVSSKRPVYMFAFGEYNSKQVNVSGIQHYFTQIYGQEFRTENLNAANIYLFCIILTKCKYIYRSFESQSVFVRVAVVNGSLNAVLCFNEFKRKPLNISKINFFLQLSKQCID